MTDWKDDMLSEDETGDNIIELTDIVESGSDHTTPEAIIELTDIVETGSTDFNLDIVEEDGFGLKKNIETEEEISFNEGLDLEMGDPADGELSAPEELIESVAGLNVSQEQVEAALERVIEKKFVDKIETILFEAVEKVIEKEIAGIKERLQKDLDQMENC